MKKFFSLMCAVVMVLSASAVPANVLSTSKQADALEVAKHAKAVKAFPATHFQKADRAAVAFKAPQAKQDADPIEIVSYTESFFESDNDVYVKLMDADGNAYIFDVVVDSATTELVLDSIYTLESMLPKFSYMRDSDYNKTVFKTASLKKSISMYEDQKLVRFDAAFTDSLDNSYTLVYQQAPFIITGDTIDVFFAERMNKPIYAQGLCQLRTKIDTMDIAFAFACEAGAPAGTYADTQMNLNYTFVNDLKAKNAHCVVTENNGSINLDGCILAGDGNVYHVTMFFVAPTPQSEVTITATNLAIDDSWAGIFGVIFAEASNEDYAVEITFDGYSTSDIIGSFDLDDIELEIVDAQDNEIELYSGSITVANTADGIAITGTALSMDGVQYTLNLTYVIPDATSQETITMSGKITNYEGQAWQFIGSTANQMVTIAAYATSIPGTYGRSDLIADYTYVIKVVDNDTLAYLMVDANITVAVSGQNATITGTLKGQNYYDSSDVIEFTLNLTATVEDYEEPKGNEYDAKDEAYKHIFAEYTVDDQYLAEYNVLIVEAQDAENNKISLEFNVAEGVTELAAGVYPINETYEEGTVSAGYIDQYIYGSFAGSLDDEGYIKVPLWLLVDGNVTVLANGVIQVVATNTWGAQIECQLGTWPEGIENTEAVNGVNKRLVNGQLVIEKNGVKYNAVGSIVK